MQPMALQRCCRASDASNAARAKARATGWQADAAALSEVPYGGLELVSCSGLYSVQLFHDMLYSTPDEPLRTRIKSDSEFLLSYFEMESDVPVDLVGPWALRVVLNREALYGFDMERFCTDPSDNTLPGFRLGKHIFPPAAGPHKGALVVPADNNAEELFMHIRFANDEEALLDKLLVDMRERGSMADVDAVVESFRKDAPPRKTARYTPFLF
jgi:hypothetical protein